VSRKISGRCEEGTFCQVTFFKGGVRQIGDSAVSGGVRGGTPRSGERTGRGTRPHVGGLGGRPPRGRRRRSRPRRSPTAGEAGGPEPPLGGLGGLPPKECVGGESRTVVASDNVRSAAPKPTRINMNHSVQQNVELSDATTSRSPRRRRYRRVSAAIRLAGRLARGRRGRGDAIGRERPDVQETGSRDLDCGCRSCRQRRRGTR
jgi:hypothetical protein